MPGWSRKGRGVGRLQSRAPAPHPERGQAGHCRGGDGHHQDGQGYFQQAVVRLDLHDGAVGKGPGQEVGDVDPHPGLTGSAAITGDRRKDLG